MSQSGKQDTAVNLLEVSNLASQLMAQYSLDGWSFAFNKNKRRLGVCKQDSKRIELSAVFAERNSSEQVVDTILHEIAHALVGVCHGHDRRWKDMCLALGCNPEACSDEAQMPVGYWQARCPCCRTLFARHRRPTSLRGRYCGPCGPEKGTLTFADVRVPRQKRSSVSIDGEVQQLVLKLF